MTIGSGNNSSKNPIWPCKEQSPSAKCLNIQSNPCRSSQKLTSMPLKLNKSDPNLHTRTSPTTWLAETSMTSVEIAPLSTKEVLQRTVLPTANSAEPAQKFNHFECRCCSKRHNQVNMIADEDENMVQWLWWRICHWIAPWAKHSTQEGNPCYPLFQWQTSWNQTWLGPKAMYCHNIMEHSETSETRNKLTTPGALK